MSTSIDSDIQHATGDNQSPDVGADLNEEDKRWLPDGQIGRQLDQETVRERDLLRWPSVVCIIANRMIGSGIFLTPSTLMQYTQSVGITLLFWVAGAITALCGTLMFIEYGLRSPRFHLRDTALGIKQPLPRSGGELYYLKDVLRKPAFLAVSLYGIAFILLGNIATNSMAFGVRVLQAAGRADPIDGWEARGIALAILTFTCALHTLWRIGGIRFSNVLAVIKLAMLFLIFITGCLTWGGVFKRQTDAIPNMTAPDAFKNPSTDAYSFAQAYLSIIFAYGGFNQANYVLGEVYKPKENYKLPAFLTVLGVCILYLLVNISYMLVVPADEQKAGQDVALRFFELTFGSISPDGAAIAPRILAGFMAISSLGNLVVMTYTAARVKQEIAKEGILPFYSFFAKNRPVPSKAKDNPVPLGALFLHWAVSTLLILATAPLAPLQAYRILVQLYSYTIDAIFGVVLGVGIFILRLRRKSSRSFTHETFMPAWISFGSAAVYGLSMAYPVITSYIPPSADFALAFPFKGLPWYSVATVGWCCVAAGAAWWVGFRLVYVRQHHDEQLVVKRWLLKTEHDTMEHETIQFCWRMGDTGGKKMREEAYIIESYDAARIPLHQGAV